MNPYWVRMKDLAPFPPLVLGVGVTAWSEADARAIVSDVIQDGSIASVDLITDMRTIEQNHVAPNIEPDWMRRGVWYPRGYRPISN
jgi:hypothetical protein